MSTPRLRLLLIGAWITLACVTFVAVGSVAPRSWLLLLLGGVIPPLMLVWLWTEDGPQLIGSLRSTSRRP